MGAPRGSVGLWGRAGLGADIFIGECEPCRNNQVFVRQEDSSWHITAPGMRRFVRACVADALEREKPTLEEYLAERLQLPMGFPYRFDPAAVLIREVRSFKITALAKADLPPVRVEALFKAWLAHRAVKLRGEWDPGAIDADVKLEAHGTVTASGTYTIAPRSAMLTSWWRDAMPAASQWIPRSS